MNRYRTSALLNFNIKAYLEKEFVNNGLYVNVASGFTDVYGNRADVLMRSNARTYESAFDRWVVESDASGIASYTTTVCSGVTIDGVFYAKGSGNYAPVIDYENGRILFSADVPSTSTVQAVFSYKQVIVDYPESAKVNLLFSQIKDNTDLTTYAYPSGNQRQVPSVIIELQDKSSVPFALGGYKKSIQKVQFHILANNDDELDLIADILDDKFRNVIKGVDFNKTPEQYTYQGDRASTYQSYTQLQANAAYSWTKMYIDSSTERKRTRFYGLKRGRVDWEISMILNQ